MATLLPRTALIAHDRRRGMEVVEVAVILPLIVLITFGMAEYGWYFYKGEQVNNAARVGARKAILADATLDQVRTAVQNSLTNSGFFSPGYTWNPGWVTVGPAGWQTATSGTAITVSVSVPYKEVVPLTGLLDFAIPDTLHASVSMAKEGP